jgi:uncharacterized membrane-anchored protein
MNPAAWQATTQAALNLGLINEHAPNTPEPSAPWPLRLMMGLGGWLVAVPMLGLIGLLIGETFHGYGGLGWGLFAICLSLVVLSMALGLFAEQLLVATLTAGVLLCGFSVGIERGWTSGMWTVGVLFAVLPWWLSQSWLRTVFGAGAACTLGLALASTGDWWHVSGPTRTASLWLVLHAWVLLSGTALYLADGWRTARWTASQLQCLNDLAQGWIAITLLGLAVLSGMTFLVGGVLGAGVTWGLTGAGTPAWLHWASATLALTAGAALAWQSAGLRRPWLAGVMLCVAALAWWVPVLGGVLLALAVLLGSQRAVLAGAAAVAAAWAVGAFYYSLAMPLTDKALLLLALALLLLCLAWWGERSTALTQHPDTSSAAVPSQAINKGRCSWPAAVTAVLVMLVVNLSIWQKEQLIRHGQAVFVPLAPLDPRSLMQGDFMRLEFVGQATRAEINRDRDNPARAYMVFKLDAQGIAQTPRFERGTQRPLAAGEMRLPLTHKAGNWVLVTDAFYFKEGEAKRWEEARFGEFRVDTSGRALLVGLRGENLSKL